MHQRTVTIKKGKPPRGGASTPFNRRDPKTGEPGVPFDSEVKYRPGENHRNKPGTPSDAVLIHELDHSQRNGSANDRTEYPNPDSQRFPNAEEHAAVGTENAYRKETGLPPRVNSTGKPSYYAPTP
jgi:hypothetical protein